MTRAEVLRRYPRVVAHVIAESLGYATPSLAARIVADAKDGRPNYCEWIAGCYRGDPRAAVKDAVARRHRHQGLAREPLQALPVPLPDPDAGLQAEPVPGDAEGLLGLPPPPWPWRWFRRPSRASLREVHGPACANGVPEEGGASR